MSTIIEELKQAAVLATEGVPESHAHGKRPALAPPDLPRLPDEFWQERASLSHIRQAAHSRQRGADAVLHSVLARIAAFRPPAVEIDTGVGSPASLNYYSVLVAPTGAGKSSSTKIARNLIPAPADYELPDPLPIGSGEGLAEAYMGMVTRQGDDGKPIKVREQVRHHALFYVDEGERLINEMERRGSTLGEALRRGWGGEVLGQFNATPERTRVVKHYSLGVIIGFQVDTILPLLRDAATGTVQRLTFASVVDPSIPDRRPAWPGPLTLRLIERFEPYTVDPDVLRRIQDEDRMSARGLLRRDPLDEHEPLARIKLAALLATLDDRHHVTPDDWRLAGTMWEVSCAIRNMLIDYARAKQREQDRQARREHASKAVAADQAVKYVEAAVSRVARVIVRKVRRDGPADLNELRRAVASRDRHHLSRAVAYAERHGWLLDDDGTYRLGDAEP